LSWPASARVREVGPRDGLQSERASLATADKIRLLDALSGTGLRFIEAVSFVSPKAIPQMADAREVWRGMTRNPDIFYSALVPNRRGAEIAADVGADGMQVFIAATDSYNLRNLRRTVDESMKDIAEVATLGEKTGIPVEGTVSVAFGCPYEGDVAPERVVAVSRRLMDLGIDTISFGDTTGMATPRRVRDVVGALESELPDLGLNMHFHDTRGTGLANVLSALELGVDYFDSSVGGMGGSPYAEGASGNIATEDLVHMLQDMEIVTGVNLEALLEASRVAQSLVPGELPSALLRAGPRLPLGEAPSGARATIV
jgi:hydroxymethylglutaryl-CoA lyase